MNNLTHLLSLSSSSSSNSTSSSNNNNNNNSIDNQTNQHKSVIMVTKQPESKLKKAKSISSQSIASSIVTPSSSISSSSTTNSSNNIAFKQNDLDCSSTNSSVKSRNNSSSQNSFTREIKNLLDIAENRTKQLCKVYDSSLNDQENLMMNEHSFKRIQSLRTKQELIKVAPNDYKGIINLNYLNSTKKQSNVISKVKLWNQLFESGQLSEKWDKEFISQ